MNSRIINIKRIFDFDIEDVIRNINKILSQDGKGYVNPRSIETEHKRKNVYVFALDDYVCAYAIMNSNKMLWNLVVFPEFRNKGLGSEIMKQLNPLRVRVKAKPIGHLSKKQLDLVIDQGT